MTDRLKPRRGRAGAFAADRTDLEDVTAGAPPPAPLGDLMPKVAKNREAAPSGGRSKGEQSAPEQSRMETPRGAGGRPAREPDRPRSGQVRGVSKRPARIPADLYQRAEPLVKGPGKPSWGQLIYWVCTTRREDVVRGAIEWVKPSDPLAPRGANRAGGVTTPIIPQFLGEEILPVDDVKDAAASSLADADSPGGRAKVTATAVVIAALTVAADNPPGGHASEGPESRETL